MAGTVELVSGCWDARCLSEKSARKRCARGAVSEVRVLRKARTVLLVGEEVCGASGVVAEGAMIGGTNFGGVEKDWSE